MSDAHALTLALHGRWYGAYGLAFCPAHTNHRTPALRLADGHDGRLLAKCSAGCDFLDVVRSLADFGLVDRAGHDHRGNASVAARRAAEEADERRRLLRARNLWAEGGPVEGTLGERYLRGRAIRSDLPPTLRFHPEAWHVSGRRLPALVAAVSREGEPRPVAVHRTYLEEPGRKADVTPSKAALGVSGGGAVRLSWGPGPLVVAEGIETALSLLDRLADQVPNLWAGLSTAGVAGLRLPNPPGNLRIAPDGDPAGLAAAEKLACRAHWQGWAVAIIDPPGPDIDWNDFAQRELTA